MSVVVRVLNKSWSSQDLLEYQKIAITGFCNPLRNHSATLPFGTLVSANVLLPTFYFITRFIIINTT